MIDSVLLITYTISPKGGSEPKIAWNNFKIAQSACRHVHVVTNQMLLKNLNEFPEISNSSRVTVHFVGVPRIVTKIPTILGDYLQYFLWIHRARIEAKRIADSEKLTLGHHVSWGNLAFGTPLCDLDIPYLFGPAGGGTKKIPTPFTIEALAFEIAEIMRLIVMKIMTRSSFTVRSLKNAKLVLATNSDSYDYAVKAGAKLVKLSLADSIDTEKIISTRLHPKSRNVLWAGRFLPRKAPLDAVEAFREVHKLIPDLTMTMVGNGPLYKKVAKRIETYGLTHAIHLHNRVEWDELLKLMLESKCLLFTSLRDSFGSQILEAAACGTPTVMHGGIPALEWIDSPAAIYRLSKYERGSIENLASALLACVTMEAAEWSVASQAAIEFAKRHSTDTKSQELIDYYNWTRKNR
jgi:glycosyltransferase involved in cell wall biosynthesis